MKTGAGFGHRGKAAAETATASWGEGGLLLQHNCMEHPRNRACGWGGGTEAHGERNANGNALFLQPSPRAPAPRCGASLGGEEKALPQ